jgi:uncharacterized protein YjdB
VISAPFAAARPACGLRPRLRSYLLTGFALATFFPGPSAAAQTVAEVQVTPETMTLGVGQKQAIFATTFDQRGNLIPSAKITFWSSDSLIAQVQKDGTVLGVRPGLAKIEARSQGKRASLAVLITGTARGTPVATVLTLEPATATLLPGESVRITPQALRDNGAPSPVARVTWKSLNPEVARVDSAGTVFGVGAGRTIIQAATGSRLMATLPVEVAPADFVLTRTKLTLGPDEVDTIRVLVPTQGNREARTLVQWRSSDSTVASVSLSGVVRARAAGQAEIIASGPAQERRVTVSVHPLPDALVVSPRQGGTVQIPLRSSHHFTAEAEAVDSSPIPEAKVTWKLSDSAIASFDQATGTLTPKVLGTTTLTATLPGITPAVWTIQVVPGDILLNPARAGLLVGQRATLAVHIKEDTGSTSSKPSGIRWTSDRPDVALVRDGVVDGLSPGHALVTATASWGKSGTADVYVVGDLLLTSNRDGAFGIYQMRVSGSAGFIPILVDNASNIQAVLSPDRTRVAFSSNRTTNYDIYLVDADGHNLRRLTANPGNEGEPAWTPDGKRIVYTATTGATTQIASVAVDGTDNRMLTLGVSRNQSPAVSADGRTIGFVSTRDGNQEIYTMGLDGSNQRRMTKNSVRDSNPRFLPSGEIVYVTERGGKSKGSRVMRGGAAGTAGMLFETDLPIASLALSREGDRVAYVVARLADVSKGRVEFSLFLQSTAPGSPPVAVPIRPGEQILNPSF